jgi:hypothetical protein
MNAMRTQEQMDADLEVEIDAACERMSKGKSEAEQRAAWTEMAVLIRRRSPMQVMKMELERRIARKATET